MTVSRYSARAFLNRRVGGRGGARRAWTKRRDSFALRRMVSRSRTTFSAAVRLWETTNLPTEHPSNTAARASSALSSGVTLATNRPDLRCAVALAMKAMCATLCHKSSRLLSAEPQSKIKNQKSPLGTVGTVRDGRGTAARVRIARVYRPWDGGTAVHPQGTPYPPLFLPVFPGPAFSGYPPYEPSPPISTNPEQSRPEIFRRSVRVTQIGLRWGLRNGIVTVTPPFRHPASLTSHPHA